MTTMVVVAVLVVIWVNDRVMTMMWWLCWW